MGEEEAAVARGRAGGGLAGLLANRNLVIAAGIGGAVFLLIVLFVFGRSLFGGGGLKGYTVILSHLTPKEAAEVAGELKTNLKIPIRLMEEGTAVAVPKDKADDARIGLASKGLPQGGVVGFEIFDKGGLGTTDFDRRIKFIRAISGELSRNISRMAGVEEARVQIVMPETQIFTPQKSPVTASVLLRLRRGMTLNQDQVEGIIRLVCGSVEGLKPENVTVVDISGYILSQPKTVARAAAAQREAEQLVSQEEGAQVYQSETEQETILKNHKTFPLGEQAFEQLKYKEQLEENLKAKAQAALDLYYLPNKARVWVNVSLAEQQQPQPAQDQAAALLPWKLDKLSAVVLVDDQDPLAKKEMAFSELKKLTFEVVAGAIGYDAGRGDRIELKRVPFGEISAQTASGMTGQAAAETKPAGKKLPLSSLLAVWKSIWFWLAAGLFLLVLLVVVYSRFRRPKAPEIDLRRGRTQGPAESGQWSSQPAAQKMRQVAEANPEKFAEVLKNWFQEGESEKQT